MNTEAVCIKTVADNVQVYTVILFV